MKKTETKIIVGFPCIGKTTLYRNNKDKYFDLEFRETATSKGMSDKEIFDLFSHYVEIVKLILEANFYEYLFLTDNEHMIKQLVHNEINYSLVVPKPETFGDYNKNKEYINFHHNLVLDRNDEVWYQNIISPRLNKLVDIILLTENANNKIIYLDNEHKYLKDVIGMI